MLCLSHLRNYFYVWGLWSLRRSDDFDNDGRTFNPTAFCKKRYALCHCNNKNYKILKAECFSPLNTEKRYWTFASHYRNQFTCSLCVCMYVCFTHNQGEACRSTSSKTISKLSAFVWQLNLAVIIAFTAAIEWWWSEKKKSQERNGEEELLLCAFVVACRIIKFGLTKKISRKSAKSGEKTRQ